MTLFDVFRRHAAERPTARWLSFETADGRFRDWTFAEFLSDTLEAAELLKGAALTSGSTFVVCLDNHPALVMMILAASATGLVAVPIDPRLTAVEMRHVCDVARPHLIVARHGHEPAAALSQERGLHLVSIGDPLSPLPKAGTERDGEVGLGVATDVVELLFTSGSTSRPKAVMLTNSSLLHGSGSMASGAGFTSDDVPLVALPLHHAAAQIHQLWPTLVLGGRVAVLERFSASRFFAQALRHRATTSAQFAATLRMILARSPAQQPAAGGLRHITFAQRLTDAEFVEWQDRFGVPLQHVWGMTETSGLPIMSPLEGDRRLSAMGRPVPQYEVFLRDTAGAVCPPGAVGEITVRANLGSEVMAGYFEDEAATLAAVPDGYLRTGDMAQTDPDGFLHFVGRHGDIIRRGAVNFSALEVEEVIRGLDGVVDVAVVGFPDPVLDDRVVAFVVVEDATVDCRAIDARCRSSLAQYKCPEHINFVDELPRTAVGKVQKHRLVAPTPQEAP